MPVVIVSWRAPKGRIRRMLSNQGLEQEVVKRHGISEKEKLHSCFYGEFLTQETRGYAYEKLCSFIIRVSILISPRAISPFVETLKNLNTVL